MELHRPTGNVILVVLLVMAGIGALIVPFLADLLTAAAGGALFYGVALALWTTVQRGSGHVVTTNLLKAA